MKLDLARTFLSLSLLLAALLCGACGDSSKAPQSNAGAQPATAKTPLVQKPVVADWCKEHGVPESVCTRCNAKLVEQFQAKGDWCKEHGLPESQCIACHPELEAKLKALAPKEGGLGIASSNLRAARSNA